MIHAREHTRDPELFLGTQYETNEDVIPCAESGRVEHQVTGPDVEQGYLFTVHHDHSTAVHPKLYQATVGITGHDLQYAHNVVDPANHASDA